MHSKLNTAYKSFFWKRFFILFALIFLISISNEPYIIKNPFEELEDVGAFIFFLLYYLLMTSAMAAFAVSVVWKFKQAKNNRIPMNIYFFKLKLVFIISCIIK